MKLNDYSYLPHTFFDCENNRKSAENFIGHLNKQMSVHCGINLEQWLVCFPSKFSCLRKFATFSRRQRPNSWRQNNFIECHLNKN